MRGYFPELKFLVKVKVESNLSNNAKKKKKKQIKKNATGIEASPFAKKVNLANLKSDVDKSDIDKLKNIATN